MARDGELVNFPVSGCVNRHRFLRARLASLALVLMVSPGTAWAAVKQVLILNSFDPHTMHYQQTAEGFRQEMQRRLGNEVSFTEMNLDARWDSDEREPILAELLRLRQDHLPLDLVFAEGPPAITFWLKHRDAIAPEAPLVSVARSQTFGRGDFRPSDVALWAEFSFGAAVEDILTLLPETERVLIVLGSSEAERQLTAQAKRELKGHRNIVFEYTNDLSIGQLQQRIERLPPRSVVYLTIFSTDVNGAILRGHAALSIARAITPVPIFGPFDAQLGQGIVGGRLIQLREIGEMAGEAATSLLNGEPAPDGWQVLPLGVPSYDARELKRWSIESNLPPRSEIRFQQEPVWRRYAAETVLALAFLAGQSLLIGALLIQRRRARQAQRSQRRLAGLLIDAHEDEHRRIARELHDDLSQRLARLAIDVGLMSRSEQADGLRGPLASVQTEIASLSEDVHGLSYRLHPSIVDDLGIATALRTECQRVREHDSVGIEIDIEPLDQPCPRDVALCIYRICQEALTNATRHARASNIEVHLAREGNSLALTVRDDGCGFEPGRIRLGLGLSSMRERAHLLGGTVWLMSTPGQGTTVRAHLPLTREVMKP